MCQKQFHLQCSSFGKSFFTQVWMEIVIIKVPQVELCKTCVKKVLGDNSFSFSPFCLKLGTALKYIGLDCFIVEKTTINAAHWDCIPTTQTRLLIHTNTHIHTHTRHDTYTTRHIHDTTQTQLRAQLLKV